MSLSDEEFLAQFENQTLPPDLFKHKDHLRLTWLVLNSTGGDTDAAVAKVCTGINAYAASLGVADKFHRTITETLVRLVAVRTVDLVEPTWGAFEQQNIDMFEDALGVLAQYYSSELLFSDQARLELVSPDLQPLPRI